MTDTIVQTTTVSVDNTLTTQAPADTIASDELNKAGIVSKKIVDASLDGEKAASAANPEECATAAQAQATDASEVADSMEVNKKEEEGGKGQGLSKGDDVAEGSADDKATTGVDIGDAGNASKELKQSSATEATNPQPEDLTKSEPQSKSKKRSYDQITKPAAEETS